MQFNSTWTTQAIDNTGPQDDVYLAEFGGSLDTNDYIIIGRDDQGTIGEFVKILEIKDEVAQTLKVSDCGTPDKTVFEVNSKSLPLILSENLFCKLKLKLIQFEIFTAAQ